MAGAVAVARKENTTRGASRIGCVRVLDGKIVAEGRNEVGLRQTLRRMQRSWRSAGHARR